LALGLNELPAEQRARLQVVPGPAESASPAIHSGSVVIADPPRRGLEPEVLRVLAERAPAQLLYLSCDLGSLVRDAEQLGAAGLRLEHAIGYDAFPYTEHLETLACFRRGRPF
jgi:tRNA/tmRNA/rRNA uracil-C5-methylase (TrmA/RlmC/RlmD family)